MRRLAMFIFIGTVATGCKREKGEPAAETPQRGQTFSSSTGKFEAWFPANPTDENSKNPQLVKLLAPEQKGMYMISARQLDHKVDLANTASTDLFMAGARIGLLAGPNKGGKIVSDEKYKLDGKYPAARIDVESPKLGIYRIRMIQTTTHFYQVIVAGPKEFVEGADATKFLESFKIVS
jgi:hypothetical protein